MTLISFLYLVTTKVIQHNLEKKVPIYVYYLYKNLENESKLLTKKLLDQTNSSTTGDGSTTPKTIEEILKGLDAKSYCEALAKDINIIGDVDCENIEQKDTKEEEIITHHSSQRNVTSQKTINLSIDDSTGRINTINDNTYMILDEKLYFIDQSNKYEITNITFDDNGNLIGEKNNIIDTIIPASQLNIKIETEEPYTEVTNNSTTFDLSKKPQNKNFTSINNIDIAFVLNKKNVTKKEQNCICASKFNIALTINMPEIGYHRDDTIDTKTGKINPPKYPTIFNVYYVAEMIARSFGYKLNTLPTITIDNKSVTKPNNNLENHIISQSEFKFDRFSMCIRQDCSDYSEKVQKNSLYNWLEMYRVIQHYTTTNCKVKNTTQPCLNPLFSSGKWDINNYVYKYIMYHLGYITIPYAKYLENFNYANSEAYYTKWNNFFTNYNSVEIMDRMKCSKTFTRNEFVSEKINLISNLNDIEHSFFIYASIDTPFDKGEMNKNIFVFEQFGNKIIPVGYLANNANSPLKFDVITRNPQTFKIEKVNYYNGSEKRPLTFCEAMSYTGEEFSQYCGCKDGSNNVVTQYSTKNEQCNNHFGCIIRPVKPGLSGRF